MQVHAPPARRAATAVLFGLIALGLVVVIVLANTPTAPPATQGGGGEALTCTPVAGFPHVHGLAVHPEEPRTVFVATHHGLVRGSDDAGWCRVGATQDDLMGFTLHPTDGTRMWSSGHPVGGGNMGVRHSTDGGVTWTTLGLEGVDFHAMSVSPADPDRLWGHFAGRLYRSDDGGHAWSILTDMRNAPTTLAGDPNDPDVVYATGPSGGFRSADGGRTWEMVFAEPVAGFALHPTDADIRLRVTIDGMQRSEDGGATWATTGFDGGGGTIGYIAFARSAPETVYAATSPGTLFRSDDGGIAWVQVHPVA